MDGLEWKRTKYSKKTQAFLKYAERIAVNKSDYLVADSIGIKKYLFEKYNTDSIYIPYGAELFSGSDQNVLKQFNLNAYKYDMLIARLEPENSIEMILDGFVKSASDRLFLVVANYKTSYGKYLTDKYQSNKTILFLGPIYDLNILNNLRYYSNLYFHGHTVGGTNPSLLEAMASNALIAANKNDFNTAILEQDAHYFSNSDEVSQLLNTISKNEDEQKKTKDNSMKIISQYTWERIVSSYVELFIKVMKVK